jgi:hypothetical protein
MPCRAAHLDEQAARASWPRLQAAKGVREHGDAPQSRAGRADASRRTAGSSVGSELAVPGPSRTTSATGAARAQSRRRDRVPRQAPRTPGQRPRRGGRAGAGGRAAAARARHAGPEGEPPRPRLGTRRRAADEAARPRAGEGGARRSHGGRWAGGRRRRGRAKAEPRRDGRVAPSRAETAPWPGLGMPGTRRAPRPRRPHARERGGTREEKEMGLTVERGRANGRDGGGFERREQWGERKGMSWGKGMNRGRPRGLQAGPTRRGGGGWATAPRARRRRERASRWAAGPRASRTAQGEGEFFAGPGGRRAAGPQAPSRPKTREKRGERRPDWAARRRNGPRERRRGFSIYFSYSSHNSSLECMIHKLSQSNNKNS